MSEGAQYWGVWNWFVSGGMPREIVVAVCATKEQAAEVMREMTLKELDDEELPVFDRARLFVQPVYVRGLVPG